VRELREFRVHHPDFVRHGLAVAGVTRDTVESNRAWSERLHLPYPLLSDPDGQAGRSLGVVRRIPLGAWKLDLFRRSTFLIDLHGIVAAVWREVRIRGHADEVLDVARTLAHPAS
jgi:peroxiredoxin Q/BCP